jgi:acetyl-CoA carboxylase biotin carboxyl carrier protein
VRDVTIDLEELAAVIRLLKEAEFSEFSYVKGDVSLVVRRGDAPVAAAAMAPPPAPPAPVAARQPSPAAPRPASPPAPAAAPEDVAGAKVRAPLLGTFYATPKPGEPPFVRLGDRVEPDTVVCIVEVMKLMNSVSAGVSGVVAAIHARDGDLVEFEQPLFTVVEAQ